MMFSKPKICEARATCSWFVLPSVRGIGAAAVASFCLLGAVSAQAATQTVFKKWAAIEQNGICVVGTISGPHELRVFLDESNRLIMHFNIAGLSLPSRNVLIAIQIDKNSAWSFGDAAGEGNTVSFSIPGDARGPKIVRELLDGASLDLVSNLGVAAASFDLSGSGAAMRSLQKCNAKGGDG